MLRRIRNRFRRLHIDLEMRAIKRQGPVDPEDLCRAQWQNSLADPLRFYLKCFRFFHNQLPEEIRLHRKYFTRNMRGFGEDAFHVMWFVLTREFAIRRFLEIGVYRGQTLSLIALLQRMNGLDGTVTGISPFSSAGDSVSSYLDGIDYLEDTQSNFRAFSLASPELVRACSTDEDSVKTIRSREWDCIYIDGNHDYEVACADWSNAAGAVKPGGLIVLDDSALTTGFVPPSFATKGHPGPSRLAAELDRNQFEEILQVGHNRVFRRVA